MSMPFRLELSENCATSLPFAGHTQSSPSSSPGDGPGDGDATLDGGAEALDGAALATTPGAGDAGGGAFAATTSGAADARATSRIACSDHGSLITFGEVLVSPSDGRAPA